MQYSQASVTDITARILEIIKRVKGSLSLSDMFTPILAILYANHKGYSIRVTRPHRIEFEPKDDRLYQDLTNLIPNDEHLHASLIKFLEYVGPSMFEEMKSHYVEILRGLFDIISYNSGKSDGDFFTPSAITKLMAYIVSKEKCQSVYDPFCGTASIIHELELYGQVPLFAGQEINFLTSIYARLNAEALYHDDNCIANHDSIINWNRGWFDAVVSCPPFNLKLSYERLCEANHATPGRLCRSYEDIILSRPFVYNNARLTVTQLPIGFCFRGHYDYGLRRELVEHNLIDKIIALPANILYSTSVSSIILVCKRGRAIDEPIYFIHAENYLCNVDGKKRTFDFDHFVEMIEGDQRDVVKVYPQEVRQYDYNLNPQLYHKPDFDLKDGQILIRLEDALTPIEGERIPSGEIESAISTNNLSGDIIDVMLNNGKLSKLSDRRRNIGFRAIQPSKAKYLLVYSSLTDNRYGINTEGKGFAYSIDIKVYKINESLVTPEYIAYTVINNKAISKGGMSLSGFMKLPIIVDNLANQKEIIEKISQEYAATVRAEQEADAKRLGVEQNASDLDHMLQTTYANLGDIIYKLEKFQPEDNVLHTLVKRLKDNVDYLKRVIQYDSAHISSENFNIKEYDIEEFIRDYCSSWINYSGNYFSLSFKSNLGNNKKVTFDKAFFKVMLDSILTNAERHGFDKRRSDDNNVEISLSTEKYGDKAYVVIRVANNGYPFKNGFTIKDYITRGRYSANTGRSGLGGYHVYSIIKGHGGYMYIDSNKIWSVIIELLLPINNVELDNLVEYENECI